MLRCAVIIVDRNGIDKVETALLRPLDEFILAQTVGCSLHSGGTGRHAQVKHLSQDRFTLCGRAGQVAGFDFAVYLVFDPLAAGQFAVDCRSADLRHGVVAEIHFTTRVGVVEDPRILEGTGQGRVRIGFDAGDQFDQGIPRITDGVEQSDTSPRLTEAKSSHESGQFGVAGNFDRELFKTTQAGVDPVGSFRIILRQGTLIEVIGQTLVVGIGQVGRNIQTEVTRCGNQCFTAQGFEAIYRVALDIVEPNLAADFLGSDDVRQLVEHRVDRAIAVVLCIQVESDVVGIAVVVGEESGPRCIVAEPSDLHADGIEIDSAAKELGELTGTQLHVLRCVAGVYRAQEGRDIGKGSGTEESADIVADNLHASAVGLVGSHRIDGSGQELRAGHRAEIGQRSWRLTGDDTIGPHRGGIFAGDDRLVSAIDFSLGQRRSLGIGQATEGLDEAGLGCSAESADGLRRKRCSNAKSSISDIIGSRNSSGSCAIRSAHTFGSPLRIRSRSASGTRFSNSGENFSRAKPANRDLSGGLISSSWLLGRDGAFGVEVCIGLFPLKVLFNLFGPTLLRLG